MLTRRSFVGSAGIAAVGAVAGTGAWAKVHAGRARRQLADLDPLETMVRLRARTDGGLSIAWLDAQREMYIDDEITPLVRLYAVVLTRFRREGPVFIGNTVEITYYCDPKTSQLATMIMMPGGKEPVDVPIYRSGPQPVRFANHLDEWEQHDPARTSGASAAFAPASSVHLVRGVHQPTITNGRLYVRGDEYGRVYPDRSKPPTVFYREWIVWQADPDLVLNTDMPDVPSTFSYSAASGLRPWMKLEGVNGHTLENGVGAKVARMADLPAPLIALLEQHDPHVLHNPEDMLR